MSASSELLIEQIRNVDEQIKQAEANGGDTTSLRKQRALLNEKFEAATHALNEGRNVLKG